MNAHCLMRMLTLLTRSQSSQLAEPLWTDPGLKSGISVRQLAGNELSNILPKSSHVKKKPPLTLLIIHLFKTEVFLLLLLSTLFIYLVLINRRTGPQYQRVKPYVLFFNRGNTEEATSSKIVCLTFVYVLFYVNLCQG